MSVRILTGDVRDVLPTLASGSVQCVVTSPPYYGLRDYGTAQWDGGDAECDHTQLRSIGASTLKNDGRPIIGIQPHEKAAQIGTPYRDTCGKCGARRIDAQIGLEATPEEYIAEMVAVFRLVRRVLRDDGTCWVNMGDSYAGSFGAQSKREGEGFAAVGLERFGAGKSATRNASAIGAKPKDLLMMPARLALALQADGWWLRSDIIWAKPNPMPESVTDRPTSAHEHVFLLTKRSRYFYDADAVREEAINEGRIVSYDGTQKNTGHENRTYPGCKPRDILVSGRSCRNVWTIATEAFPESHFATFPPALVERCIKAGTSERGCCKACGKPWVRNVTKGAPDIERRAACGADASGGYAGQSIKGHDAAGVQNASDVKRRILDGMRERISDWAASCQCNAPVVPCTVLDPFGGAGTTGLVADRLGRNATLIELNPEYAAMARNRITRDCPLFAEAV